MKAKFNQNSLDYFGVYEEGYKKKKVYDKTVYTNLANLPKLQFYEKIIEPTYMDVFRRDNNKDVVLPTKLKLDLDNDPRLKYASKRDRLPRIYPELENYNKFVHIGQRKLFLSEIQHLSAKLKSKDEVAIVVYSGAAPTNKCWMEHIMFPNVKFLLVDPNMFNIYITTYRDSHYLHAAEKDNKIVYYGNSKTNYNSSYGLMESACQIKYFNGENEIIVPEKYSQSAPLDNKVDEVDHRYIKHFLESDNCVFINEKYFTNNTARFCNELFKERQNYPKYKDCKTFYWSDIRTDNGGERDEFPDDLDILWNTAMMYNWVKIAEPDYAMLKFRTPYLNGESIDFNRHRADFDLCAKLGNDLENVVKTSGNFSFFKGEIYHQAWHGRISTETRLWINGEDIKKNNVIIYDSVKYEETLFYYNCIRRTSMLHENKYSNISIKFDHCADCSLESNIWQSYQKLDTNLNIWFWVNWLSEVTTRPLDRAGHGFLFPVRDTKRETYQRFLQFIGGKENLQGYYTKFIDEPYRDLFKKMDTPRIVHPPKLEFNLKTDPKLNVNLKGILNFILDKTTLEYCKEIDKNRLDNFVRRSILAEIWHLADILTKDEPAIVVYIGSAKGYCLDILHELFPQVRFLFIDTYTHYISMGEFANFHYTRYLENGYITHLALNQSNFNDFYENNLGKAYGIKLFDGKTEKKISNKYEYLDTLKVTSANIHQYYDYIYTSQNRFFILEQLFDEDLALAMSMLKQQASNYSRDNHKFIFWTDAVYFQQYNVKSVQNGFYINYLRSLACVYIWLKIIQPTHAMLLFRLLKHIEIVESNNDRIFSTAKNMNYDIIFDNNQNKTIKFFKGILKVSPYMRFDNDYSQLWIQENDIISGKLVEYNPVEYSNMLAHYCIMRRFTMLSNNPHSNPLIGFDYCNDCAIESYIWDKYKKKFNKSLNITNTILYLSKLYEGKLISNIHGYLFPRNKEIDNKLYIEQHVKGLIPQIHHKLLKNLTKSKLPKFIINNNKLNFYKIEQSKYNNFINIPGRKYLLSSIAHLIIDGPCTNWPHRSFIIIYVGCKDDYTLWQLIKIFPNIRILCFEKELMDIYIEKYKNTHWLDYQNSNNNISYISINKNNILEDNLSIHPVTYFDGNDELYLIDKNDNEINTISSISEISDNDIPNYSKYLFDTNKRIFIFEEDLSLGSLNILIKIIKERESRNVLSNNDENNIYSRQLTLWTNNIPLSNVKKMINILNPQYVRCICDNNTNFDVHDFYKSDIYTLPWSSRQNTEFALHIKPNIDKIESINLKNIIDQVFYYNIIDRICLHTNVLQDKNIGFDCCGDCSLEARILTTLKNIYTMSSRFYRDIGIQDSSSVFISLCNITDISTFISSGHGMLYDIE